MPKKILIVDDEKDLTSALRNLFSASGYDTEIAQSADDAQEKLKSAFDLIILDMKMPGVGGVALLRTINDKHPDAKVIILTGYGKEYKDKVKDLKYEAFLTKPFSAQDLANTAENTLSGKGKEPQNPLYKDPFIMPKAKLLILDTDDYMLNCLNGYFSQKEHSGGEYEINIEHIIGTDLINPEHEEKIYNEVELKLTLIKPDIVLASTEIHGVRLSTKDLHSVIKNSKNSPKDIIIYGHDINIRGRYGSGISGMKKLINRLELLASGKQQAGDPVLDKLGKVVRKSCIKNNLYKKVKELIRIPNKSV